MEEIAVVYGRSLFEAALDQDKLDVVREQLGQFADALDGDRELQVFFFSPYFSTQEKNDGLERAVTDADPAVLNFLKLLIEKHRMPVVFRIRDEFDKLWEEENKLLPVIVTSAVELSSNVQPDILGGIVVRVGNQVLDASIRNRLETLRKQVVRA